jgi:hypothetical protein
MVNCEYCDKPLKKIGFDRSNGRLYAGNNGADWDGRKYHKKCYKEIMQNHKFNEYIKSFRSSNTNNSNE